MSAAKGAAQGLQSSPLSCWYWVVVAELNPGNNVPDDHPVFQVILLRNTANNGSVRELLDVAEGGVEGEVYGVEGEEEGGEHHILRGTFAAPCRTHL